LQRSRGREWRASRQIPVRKRAKEGKGKEERERCQICSSVLHSVRRPPKLSIRSFVDIASQSSPFAPGLPFPLSLCSSTLHFPSTSLRPPQTPSFSLALPTLLPLPHIQIQSRADKPTLAAPYSTTFFGTKSFLFPTSSLLTPSMAYRSISWSHCLTLVKVSLSVTS
jgi:hypothetical protein